MRASPKKEWRIGIGTYETFPYGSRNAHDPFPTSPLKTSKIGSIARGLVAMGFCRGLLLGLHYPILNVDTKNGAGGFPIVITEISERRFTMRFRIARPSSS